jgi:hypothetical protein
MKVYSITNLMILILFVITFFYIFGQNSNSLTHRKARIPFFREQREYQLGTTSFIYLFIYLFIAFPSL